MVDHKRDSGKVLPRFTVKEIGEEGDVAEGEITLLLVIKLKRAYSISEKPKKELAGLRKSWKS